MNAEAILLQIKAVVSGQQSVTALSSATDRLADSTLKLDGAAQRSAGGIAGLGTASQGASRGLQGLNAGLLNLQAGLQVAQQVAQAVQGLANQMEKWADEANKAETATAVFDLTLKRFGVSTEEANKTAANLAAQFGLSIEDVKDSMTTLIRAGFTDMGKLQEAMTGAAASAIAFGRDAKTGFENLGDAAVTGLSMALNGIGIAENLGPAFDQFARSIGKTADELDNAEKAQVIYNLVTKATATEVEALGTIQNDYVRSKQAATLADQAFSRALGETVMPTVTAFKLGLADALTRAAEFTNAMRQGGQALESYGQKYPQVTTAVRTASAVFNGLKSVFVQVSASARESFDGVVMPMLQRLAPSAQSMMGAVQPALARVGAVMVDLAALGKRAFEQVLIPAIELLAPIVMQLVQRAAPLFAGLLEIIRNAIAAVVSLWTTVLLPVFQTLAPVVKVAIDTAAKVLTPLIAALGTFTGAIRAVIEGDWTKAWDLLSKTVKGALDAVVNLFKSGGELAKSIAEAGLNLAKQFLAGFLSVTTGIEQAIADGLNNAAANMPDWMKNIVGRITGALEADAKAGRQAAAALNGPNRIDPLKSNGSFPRPLTGQGPLLPGQQRSTDLGTGLGSADTVARLRPEFQKAIAQVISQYAFNSNNGLIPYIHEGFRSIERQNALYAQGRTKPGGIVTNAQGGQSLHNYGVAADIYWRDPKTGKVVSFDDPRALEAAKALGQLATKQGLLWGGSPGFGIVDMPHIQENISWQAAAKKYGTAAPAPQATAPTNTPTPKPTPTPAPDAPTPAEIAKKLDAQIKDILAKVDIGVLNKDAANKALKAIQDRATTQARGQGAGWQEYAAAAQTAGKALEALQKPSSAAAASFKAQKDVLGDLRRQFEYVGASGLPEYVRSLQALIRQQEKVVASTQKGSDAQKAAQQVVIDARKALADAQQGKGGAFVTDANLTKYKAQALEVIALEKNLQTSTDAAWRQRATNRIEAFKKLPQEAQNVLTLLKSQDTVETNLAQRSADRVKEQAQLRARVAATNRQLSETDARQTLERIQTLNTAELEAFKGTGQARVALVRRQSQDEFNAKERLAAIIRNNAIRDAQNDTSLGAEVRDRRIQQAKDAYTTTVTQAKTTRQSVVRDAQEQAAEESKTAKREAQARSKEQRDIAARLADEKRQLTVSAAEQTLKRVQDLNKAELDAFKGTAGGRAALIKRQTEDEIAAKLAVARAVRDRDLRESANKGGSNQAERDRQIRADYAAAERRAGLDRQAAAKTAQEAVQREAAAVSGLVEKYNAAREALSKKAEAGTLTAEDMDTYARTLAGYWADAGKAGLKAIPQIKAAHAAAKAFGQAAEGLAQGVRIGVITQQNDAALAAGKYYTDAIAGVETLTRQLDAGTISTDAYSEGVAGMIGSLQALADAGDDTAKAVMDALRGMATEALDTAQRLRAIQDDNDRILLMGNIYAPAIEGAERLVAGFDAGTTSADALESGMEALITDLQVFADAGDDVAAGLIDQFRQAIARTREFQQGVTELQATLDLGSLMAPQIERAEALFASFDAGTTNAEEFEAGLTDIIARLQVFADAGDETAQRVIAFLQGGIDKARELKQTMVDIQATLDRGALMAPQIEKAEALLSDFDAGTIDASTLESGLTAIIDSLRVFADAGDEAAQSVIAFLEAGITRAREFQAGLTELQATLDRGALMAPSIETAQQLSDDFDAGKISLDALKEGLQGVVDGLQVFADAGDETAQAVIAAIQGIVDKAQAFSDGVTLFELPDPDDTRLEEWNRKLTELQEAYEAGAITAESFRQQALELLPQLDRLAKAAERQGKTDLAQIYRDAAAGLRQLGGAALKTAENLSELEKLGAGMRKLFSGLGTVFKSVGSDGLGAMADGTGEVLDGLSKMPAAINDVRDSWQNFMQQKTFSNLGTLLGSLGGALGIVGSIAQGFFTVANAIEAGNGKLNAWKKNLREIATLEKEAMGSKKYGGIQNPYYDTLAQDAANREKLADSKWYQRLWWGFTGSGPQVMEEGAAKLKASAATIFNDLAGSLSNNLTDALMKAWSTEQWEDVSKAFEKSINEFVVRQAITTMLAQSKLQDLIKAYSDARAKAMQDGVITPEEQQALDAQIANLRAEIARLKGEAEGTLSALPGAGEEGAEERAREAAELARSIAEQRRSIAEQALELQHTQGLVSTEEYEKRKLALALERIRLEMEAALAAEGLTAERIALIRQQYDLQTQQAQAEYDRQARERRERQAKDLAGLEMNNAAAALEYQFKAGLIQEEEYQQQRLALTLARIKAETEAELEKLRLEGASEELIAATREKGRLAALNAEADFKKALQGTAGVVGDTLDDLTAKRQSMLDGWRQSLMGGVSALLEGNSPLDALYAGVRSRIAQAIQDGFLVKRIVAKLDPLFEQLDGAISQGLNPDNIIRAIGAALPALSVEMTTTLSPILAALNQAIPNLTSAVNGNTAALKETQFQQTTITHFETITPNSNLRAKLARFS